MRKVLSKALLIVLFGGLLHQRSMAYLYTEHQMAVGVLQLPLPALKLLGSLLVPL